MTVSAAPQRSVGRARSDPEPATVFIASAALSVVAGGLVAAVTGPFEWAQGSWLAAYLVLVCGVGGFGIGTMQRRAAAGLSPVWARTQLGGWVGGNAAVIVGSLSGLPLGVDVGVVLLEGALVIALIRSPGIAEIGHLRSWVYRALLLVLILSAPIGSVLSHLRH